MLKKIWDNKIFKFIIRYVLPLIIIAYILLSIDFSELKSVLIHVDGRLLILGFAGTLIQFAFYTYRWELILKFIQIGYSFRKTFQIYLANFFIGSFIPGTFGGFLKVMYLTRDGWPLDKGIVSVVFEKIYEIFFTTLFALVMATLIPSLYKLPVNNLYISSAALVLIVVALYLARKPIINFIKNFAFKRLENSGAKFQTSTLLDSVKDVLSIKHTSILIFVSFMVRVGESIAFYFIARSLGSHLNFIQALFFSAVNALVGSLPVSFSGIGTRDLALIMLLTSIGDSKEIALSTSLLILFSIILMRIIGMVFWLMDPISQDGKAVKAGP